MFPIGCISCPNTRAAVARRSPVSLEEDSIVGPCPVSYELCSDVFVGGARAGQLQQSPDILKGLGLVRMEGQITDTAANGEAMRKAIVQLNSYRAEGAEARWPRDG